jgi:hypothetical protein
MILLHLGIGKNFTYNLRISNKYGSLTGNKFFMKSVTTLKYHDVYSKYATLSRFQIDVCSLVKIRFDRRIDVWNWCLISRKNSDLIWHIGIGPYRKYMFGCFIVSRQLHFHIYYLFVAYNIFKIKKSTQNSNNSKFYRTV